MGLPLLFAPVAGPVLVQGTATAPRGQQDAAPLPASARGQRDAAPLPQNVAPTTLYLAGTNGAISLVNDPLHPMLRGQRDAAPLTPGRDQCDAPGPNNPAPPVALFKAPLFFTVLGQAPALRVAVPSYDSATPLATGGKTITGSGASTLGGLTSAGTGAEVFQGTGLSTLLGLVSTGTGALAYSGTGASTLLGLMSSGVGAEVIAGSGASSLLGLLSAGTGSDVYSGSGASRLDGLVSAGEGTFEGGVIGSGASRLLALRSSGAGTSTAKAQEQPVRVRRSSGGGGGGQVISLGAAWSAVEREVARLRAQRLAEEEEARLERERLEQEVAAAAQESAAEAGSSSYPSEPEGAPSEPEPPLAIGAAEPPPQPAEKTSAGAVAALLVAGVAGAIGLTWLAGAGGKKKKKKSSPKKANPVQANSTKAKAYSSAKIASSTLIPAGSTEPMKQALVERAEGRVVVDYPARAGVTEKWIKCGKADCQSCPHGPYLYAKWDEDGRTVSKYLGKKV